MNAREALRQAEARLAAAGVETPRVDAELLLAHALATTRSGVHEQLDHEVGAELEGLLARREAREPLAYVLGQWGFRRLTLHVDRRVLVPRPETEVVVERCLALIADVDEPQVLDVGTGSGAIALAIADERPRARVTAIDASPEALEVAAANARATRLVDRVSLLRHDLDDGLDLGRFDLVVSNPPYVLPDEIDELAAEVRDWEPREALVGAGVGERVAAAARTALQPGGWLVLETAPTLAYELLRYLDDLRYVAREISQDLSGVDRVVEGQWPSRTSSARSGRAGL